MASFLTRFLVVLVAVQLLGGHWAVLRTVAWVGMAIEFAQTESLGMALEKTFNGENPCGLCHVVEHGVQEEKKQEAVRTIVKLEAVLACAVRAPLPTAERWIYPALGPSLAGLQLAPPTPPPLA